MSDPYNILGVSKTASPADIKSAYRKLAKKLHPDVNPGRKDIEQRFKEVTAAYDLLSDAKKRAKYDRGEINAQGQPQAGGGFGSRGFRDAQPKGGGGYYNYTGGASPFGNRTYKTSSGGGEDPFSSFGDIFSEFMNPSSGRKRSFSWKTRDDSQEYGGELASDTLTKIKIPFREACLGCKKRVTLPDNKTVEVTIPAGIEDNYKLRLKGQGKAGSFGEKGNAIIEVQIEPDRFLTRKGKDIYLDAPISLLEAVKGASINVPSLGGTLSIKVPKGSNTGTVLRLKGKGVTGGDMFVKLEVKLPENVSDDLANFIEKWSKTNEYKPRKTLHWE
ncbi:MAG: DnaJ domain-containing protein [Alphaproteobacteria bacterium]|nr:DnaJ domain-containing protein [Alphaproteobacteria bacterium]MCL2505685.1 DnaJ domain-containing protein [Alphaproteobacteria bacterium]